MTEIRDGGTHMGSTGVHVKVVSGFEEGDVNGRIGTRKKKREDEA